MYIMELPPYIQGSNFSYLHHVSSAPLMVASNMAELCLLCKKGFQKGFHYNSVKCDKCSLWIHKNCLGINDSLFNKLGDIHVDFYCPICINIEDRDKQFYAALKRIEKAGFTIGSVMTEDVLLQVYDQGTYMQNFQRWKGDRGRIREDKTGKHLLQQYLPNCAPTYIPVRTCADGNCLFRAVSYSLFNTEQHHDELRLRATIEAANSRDFYVRDRDNCKRYMGLLETYAPQTEESLIRELATPGNYQGAVGFFTLANVIKGGISSVHPLRRPDVPAELDYTFIAYPRDGPIGSVKAAILWSTLNVLEETAPHSITFNHFLSLVRSRSDPSEACYYATTDIDTDIENQKTGGSKLKPSKKSSKKRVRFSTEDGDKTSSSSSVVKSTVATKLNVKSDPGLDSSDEEPFIMIPKGSRKGHDLVIDDMGHRMTYKGLSVLKGDAFRDFECCKSGCIGSVRTDGKHFTVISKHSCGTNQRKKSKTQEDGKCGGQPDMHWDQEEDDMEPQNDPIERDEHMLPFRDDEEELDTTWQWRVIEGASQLKGRLLIDRQGYKFTEKTYAGRDYVYIDWRCSARRSCRAKVRCSVDLSNFQYRELHNHAPNPLMLEDVLFAKEERSKGNVHTDPGILFRESRELATQDGREPSTALQNKVRMKRRISYSRKRLAPQHPEKLEFELPESWASKLEDIRVNGQRHLLFTSTELIQILKSRKQWYMDGTFKVIRKPFRQLYSVHGYIRRGEVLKQIPLLFVVMSRRRKEDYVAILEKVKDMVGDGLNVEVFNLDFERAMWNALADVFPGKARRGCHFHHRQRIMYHVKQIDGWNTKYRKSSATRQFVRMLMGISLLPSGDIPLGMSHLRDISQDSAEAQKLLDYFSGTWLQKWTAEQISVFKIRIRTNNDLEGYHKWLNQWVGEKPGLYRLLSRLESELQDAMNERTLVCVNERTRTSNSRFVKYDKALRQAFAEYEVNAEEGRLSAVTQLLDFAANHDNELNIAANENLEDEVWGESSESEEE